MELMDHYNQYLREKHNEPNQRDESCFACKPSESHQCPNNPILTCNCADNKFCAEQPNDNGWLKCPDSGKLCSIIDCPDGCKGDKLVDDDKCPNHDGFSDNLDYVGNPYPDTKGKDTVSGWPCVVVGGICETGTSPTKHVCGTESSAGTSERMGDAGLSDGSYVSTNH